MQSIRRRLGIIIIFCSIIAVILSALFVNWALNSTFNKYMMNTQNQRNQRIVDYFQQIYKRDKKWTVNSGEEMMHEAYMSNYCLTLLDDNKNVIWGMNPNDIRERYHLMMQRAGNNNGVYTSNFFEIKTDGKIVGYVEIGQYSPILLSQQDINFKISINRSIIISVLITIFIAVIISIIISKQFSAPIKAVSDTSVKLSNGNYDSVSNIKSNIKELNNLTESINTLGKRLKEQDQLRKRLVSDISHEIRTPLNILQNNLEAMIDGIFPVNEERLNYLNDEVIRFGKLLNNLNLLKEFEEEKLTLNTTTIFLDELVSSVSNEFYIDFENKNIKFNLNIDKDKDFQIIGDEDKIKQVFINLLSNAIKFTQAGGNVWVNIDANKDKVIVKVKDDGMGIKREDLPYIFERLYRGDKSRHEIEGSGIGLTIVKRILTLHSATINVESVVGIGTSFTLYFNKKMS
ncbi:sensor histidine kinase ResE [Clostridium pasteurianum DSM 525 = ATCC 6013]|uniref:histidine kinase n=1 Tax=Clostridium pasteurianum DSM 525 = ATCC 6013 TaxID=1262449 RepID=A0A0H3J626_CLOPA|nr:HAMP domain-containing sensor histidine kinase [Clostridium pasteurianum]AJA48622.1 sensor histidine kinase ResE [Clostridium pasteurianum DSM 525 = ATCC 6013]AJA52610.1 sensor histidine kinase ResE [Clostridium pasteurianum DSM 525 = ATCC 6013]AOZ75852.1 histidine kinase [Clostridium pasteurianum DSM 525 = ATCC 6013]AOZ79648.1 histidine kinase [Clostridium pasteurianum]ELP57900.1 sensory transduction histidine kinase [Clostridium pasteurianum DSM 525 = ATCC 6013]